MVSGVYLECEKRLQRAILEFAEKNLKGVGLQGNMGGVNLMVGVRRGVLPFGYYGG